MHNRKNSYAALIAGLLLFHMSAAQDSLTVDALIDRVISGEDFTDRTLIVSGVALNASTATNSLLNLGSRETFESGRFLNFISVYDTSANIAEGQFVRIRVLVETSQATKVGGESVVAIETVFEKCISC